jgi:hypothetical protein
LQANPQHEFICRSTIRELKQQFHIMIRYLG